ncbi:MAG: type II toxin-antitoxin system PrlF family antitoxin [Elusimicrobia bacterium]|nr:type II toxin-antitoxin system PrlF family antitoxin [Elusimicrobiota bacterium]
MSNLLVAPITKKGQVTLPKAIRTVLRLNKGPDMVAFHIEKNGKVRIVGVEVKEKKTSPYTASEWAKIEKLTAQKGKSFQSAKAAREHLKNL